MTTPGASTLRHIPNAITVLRMALVAPAGWLLWHGHAAEALVLIALAGVSDAVDGVLARRYGWRTRFGAMADPAADKMLSLVVFVVLATKGHIPIWLVAIVVGRDLVIISGAIAYRRVVGSIEFDPTFLSKVNTGVQVVMLLLVVVGLADFPVVSSLADAIVDPVGFVIVGTSGVVSGIHYVLAWSKLAADAVRARRQTT